RLGLVVHTAYYIPLATPFAGLRRASLNEFRRAMRAARLLGAPLLTVHFTKPPRFFGIDVLVDWCAAVLADLCEEAAALGITVALENAPQTTVDQVAVFEALLERLPRLGLHLDSGHAQVEGNRWSEYLDRLGHRLIHVHLSDNDGRGDQHLPIAAVAGSGIDWRECLRQLRQIGYDGTITLEVFAPAREYLLVSKDLVQKLWETL
ncbi:MAG TPA: sugar phosphate isomerase/epimerase, partial [Planctomycetaceae bacterium]|nr:sugar phosphate isomerase/epimerase [Planctomycetaceae bacterium]